MIINLLITLAYGFIVGLLAKAIHPGKDPSGILATIVVGIVGSYVGGAVNFLFFGADALSMSGLIMSLLGSILVLFCWKKYQANKVTKRYTEETQDGD